jgi:catechol 2,3-dioxygenase-like lactoylglutathione lyase family enzyme
MVREVVAALALLAGCDRWSDAEPLWSVQATNRSSAALAPTMYATAGAGGETIAAVSNTKLGEIDLAEPYVVRFGSDGAILGVNAVPEVEVGIPLEIRIDASGHPTVLWWGGYDQYWIVAFDEALEERWRHLVEGQARSTQIDHRAFAVGPGGEVAYSVRDQTGRVTMRYLDADGTERWTSSPGFLSYASIIEGGDVLVYVGGEFGGNRVRYAAADGAILEEISHPEAWAVTTDGSAVSVELVADVVRFHDATAAVRWQRQVDGLGRCAFGGCRPSALERSTLVSLSPSGDVLVERNQIEIVRLDRATGNVVGEDRHCDPVAVVGGDTASYVALGPTCDMGYAIARYALPE